MEGVSFLNHYMLLRRGFIEDILSSEICTPISSITRLDRNGDVALYIHFILVKMIFITAKKLFNGFGVEMPY